MEKVVWDGTGLTAPVPPVLVTCGDGVRDNVLTVAWTGTVNTKPPMTYISLRPSRFSYGIIKETGEFAVNLVPVALIREADFCGTYTGAKVDKFAACGLTKQPAAGIAAPSDCRSGRCGWCRSQLLQGEVYVPQSVDGRRMADKLYGYVHPCCTFPLSDVGINVPPFPSEQ